MARVPIPAPQAQPPGYGLLTVVPPITDGSLRWEMYGATWRPEQCAQGGRVAIDCGIAGDLLDGNQGELGAAEPFVVYAEDRCSPFGFETLDWGGRARRQLLAIQSREVAEELWGGSLDAGTGDTHWLNEAGTTEVTDAALPPVYALAALEVALASCTNGRRSLVHMAPDLLVLLVASQALRLAGTIWTTPMGNLVVADAGYDGSGPGGKDYAGSSWMYGTGQVDVYLSDVELNPGDPAQAQVLANGAMNVRTNDVQVFAQRLAMVQWDPCCHVAAEADVTTP